MARQQLGQYMVWIFGACVLAFQSVRIAQLSEEVRALHHAKFDAVPVRSDGASFQHQRRVGKMEDFALESEYSDNVRTPMRNGKVMPLADRVRYLEKKVNGHLNWVKRPHVWYEAEQYRCKNSTNMGHGHATVVCLDNIKPPCVVYDVGIREEASFGLFFAKMGCEVHAFDPSPITEEWLKKQPELQNMPNYHFHLYGVGGVDGEFPLFEYNWGQVSLVRWETFRSPNTQQMIYPGQKRFTVPVKTLSTIMRELGHAKVDLLKLDCEGSEFLFLEQHFDEVGCPAVDQILMEYHHFDLDKRYGSSRQLNLITNMLNDCGLLQFFTRLHWWGDTKVDPAHDHQVKLRYQVASFMRPTVQKDICNAEPYHTWSNV